MQQKVNAISISKNVFLNSSQTVLGILILMAENESITVHEPDSISDLDSELFFFRLSSVDFLIKI